VLGISLAAHPLELCAAEIAKAGAVSTVEAAGKPGQKLTVAGVRQTAHRSRTAKGESMLFLTLEDFEGTLDAVLFPDAYRRVRNWIHGNDPLLVSGVMEMDAARGEPLLRVERIERIGHVAR
jgi:DNA polymerase III subunit alpha